MARPKGAKNAVGATAKENIINVFSKLGGTRGMAKWAQNNPSDFYKLYARLIPQQIDMDVSIRECDVSAEPLSADAWDQQYQSDRVN